MDNQASLNPNQMEFKQLESLVDDLIQACSRLEEENRSLRTQCKSLQSERSGLIEKTEMAKNRVEAMIQHLKSLEQGA